MSSPPSRNNINLELVRCTCPAAPFQTSLMGMSENRVQPSAVTSHPQDSDHTKAWSMKTSKSLIDLLVQFGAKTV